MFEEGARDEDPTRDSTIAPLHSTISPRVASPRVAFAAPNKRNKGVTVLHPCGLGRVFASRVYDLPYLTPRPSHTRAQK